MTGLDIRECTACDRLFTLPMGGRDTPYGMLCNGCWMSALENTGPETEIMADPPVESAAFSDAWQDMEKSIILSKGQNIGYNVHITPKSGKEVQILRTFVADLAERGVTFDRGGGANGHDFHFDDSLKNMEPDEALTMLRDTGIDFTTEMIAYDPWEEPPRPDLPNPNEIADPAGNDAYIVGPPIQCPECGNPEAAYIRESVDDGGGLTLACNECGHMDTDVE